MPVLRPFITCLEDCVENRAVYYKDGLRGQGGNWVDGSALQATRPTQTDENHHLAKVRVAASNPSSAPFGVGKSWFHSALP
jgi:hypothetical protein